MVDTDRVIVVGSGPCGAVAAHQLVERGLRVVLLDAGIAAPRGALVRGAGNVLFRRFDNTAMQSDRHLDDTGTVDWFSSLSHGGLSNFWTAAVPRFAPEDFTEGGRLGEQYVWPIRYDDLEPYYGDAEAILKVTAGDAIPTVPSGSVFRRHELSSDWADVVTAAAGQGNGMGVLPLALGDRWMAVRRSTEFASYHNVVAPLEASPNFEFRGGAHVTRLMWNSQRAMVDAVEFVDRHTGSLELMPCRAVVLAAGTVDSTSIVLRSVSDDFPNGIGNSADLVGRYLTDHPREWWRASLDRPMRALPHPVYLARRAHAESDPLMATSHTIGLAASRERVRTYVGARTSSIGVQVFGTQIPTSSLGIQLERGTEPLRDRPRITHAYDDDTRANLISGRERLREVLGRAGLQIELINPGHELRPGSSVHFAGSIRMHDDRRWGVLDGSSRMHDVTNVAVTDMSAFTTNPEKNPTLTAMALSMRAADRLADDLR